MRLKKLSNYLISYHSPLRKISVGATKTPWIDGERRESMRKRDKLAAIDSNGIEKW